MSGERRFGAVRARAERSFVRALSNPALSRGMARLADARLPGPLLRALLRTYVRAYGVDLSEAAEPLAAYPTFNAFFTRRLRDGARPVAVEPGLVVSPSDSRLQSFGPVPPEGRLEQVKGRSYALAALLGDAAEAETFARGVHATLYLSPSMYHRVHFPVDGRVTAWRYLPGRLFPVNAMAVRNVEGLFTVNERVAVTLESDDVGQVAVVLVGATNVGRMTLGFAGLTTNAGGPPVAVRLEKPIRVRRGDELGAFNLGSTVVLLAADGSLQPAGAREGEIVRMGQPLWRKP
jgi:phosphatidylserine decarboxylase